MPTCDGTSGSCWPRPVGWSGHSPRMRSITHSGRCSARPGRRCAMLDARISVLILARDEADNLPECLASVRWADEVVVVVDGSSRDRTREIAEKEADRVAVRAFDDFASQRNAALALASGDWV